MEPAEEQILVFDETAYDYLYFDIEGLSAGSFHILATDADGRVFAFGDNGFGQLGNGGDDDGTGYLLGWVETGLDLVTGEYTEPINTFDAPDIGQAL